MSSVNVFQFVIALFLSLFVTNINATHNFGGFIYGTHISGYTYKINAVTFTEKNSQADRCELVIRISNGDSCIAQRVNGVASSCPSPIKAGEAIDQSKKLNIYECIYTFPSQNIYTISILDPNRNSSINNIPNSVIIPFYIETLLYVYNPETGCVSNSIRFANIPISTALIGKKYESDCPISFTDGDSITYQLNECLVNGSPIIGYTIPEGATIEQNTGRLTWQSPTQLGSWAFAILAKKWRNGTLAGSTILDYQILVVPNPPPNTNFMLSINCNCILNTDSTFNCNTNLNDSVYISTSGLFNNVKLYTELDTNYYSITTINDIYNFKYFANSNDNNKYPYKLTFRYEKDTNGFSFYKDITFFMITNNTILNECTNLEPITVFKDTVFFYPNPASTYIKINAYEVGCILNIYNGLGQLILKEKLMNLSTRINIENFVNGVYLIELVESKRVLKRKLIKN